MYRTEYQGGSENKVVAFTFEITNVEIFEQKVEQLNKSWVKFCPKKLTVLGLYRSECLFLLKTFVVMIWKKKDKILLDGKVIWELKLSWTMRKTREIVLYYQITKDQ